MKCIFFYEDEKEMTHTHWGVKWKDRLKWIAKSANLDPMFLDQSTFDKELKNIEEETFVLVKANLLLDHRLLDKLKKAGTSAILVKNGNRLPAFKISKQDITGPLKEMNLEKFEGIDTEGYFCEEIKKPAEREFENSIFDFSVETRFDLKSPFSSYSKFTRYFNLPFSRLITRVIIGTPLNPTHITLMSLSIILLASFLLATGNFLYGSPLLYLGILLDGVDGKVARIRCQTSLTGSTIDSFFDRVGEMALILALTYISLNRLYTPLLILLGFLGAFSFNMGFYLKEYCRAETDLKWEKVYYKALDGPKIRPWDRDFSFFTAALLCILRKPELALLFISICQTTVVLLLFYSFIKSLSALESS
ncbi:MAG: CDP-alcohol phosphatidyltransferase family protein [Candidatus Hydrothermarchaeota archaeon]